MLMAMSFRSKYAYRVFFLLGCTEFIVHCTMCVAFFSFIGEISDDRKYSDEKALSASSLAPRFNIAKCLYICANATNFFFLALLSLVFFSRKAAKICSFATFFTYSCGTYILILTNGTRQKERSEQTSGLCSFKQRQQHYYRKILLASVMPTKMPTIRRSAELFAFAQFVCTDWKNVHFSTVS